MRKCYRGFVNMDYQQTRPEASKCDRDLDTSFTVQGQASYNKNLYFIPNETEEKIDTRWHFSNLNISSTFSPFETVYNKHQSLYGRISFSCCLFLLPGERETLERAQKARLAPFTTRAVSTKIFHKSCFH